jgi:hypothetical protein
MGFLLDGTEIPRTAPFGPLCSKSHRAIWVYRDADSAHAAGHDDLGSGALPASYDVRLREPPSIRVGGRYDGIVRRDAPNESFRRRRRASVVWDDDDVGGEIGDGRQQRSFSAALDIAGQQQRAAG